MLDETRSASGKSKIHTINEKAKKKHNTIHRLYASLKVIEICIGLNHQQQQMY